MIPKKGEDMDYTELTKEEKKVLEILHSGKKISFRQESRASVFLWVLAAILLLIALSGLLSHSIDRSIFNVMIISSFCFLISFLSIKIAARDSLIKKLSKQLGITKDNIPK